MPDHSDTFDGLVDLEVFGVPPAAAMEKYGAAVARDPAINVAPAANRARHGVMRPSGTLKNNLYLWALFALPTFQVPPGSGSALSLIALLTALMPSMSKQTMPPACGPRRVPTHSTFGALADSGRIEQRKNGSYRMVLKGVDEIDWFTDRPDRVEGTWKPQKLLRKWDKYFASSEPNAQVTVEVGEQRELFTFEMFKPKMKSGKMMFNIKPLSKSSEDKINGFTGKAMDKVSLFIDNSSINGPACWPNCSGIGTWFFAPNFQGAGVNLSNANLPYANLKNNVFQFAQMVNLYAPKADFTDANLYYANLNNANLLDANLTGVTFNKTNLTGANFSGATLANAYWKDTICPDGTMNDGALPCTAEQLNLA